MDIEYIVTEEGEIYCIDGVEEQLQQGDRVWSNENCLKHINLTNHAQFLGSHLLENNEPIDYFKLYFTNEFMQMIVNETNSYAEAALFKHGVDSSPRNWKKINVKEMKLFLGLLFHMGDIKAARLVDYWKNNKLYNLGFGDYIGRDRFLVILRSLHFQKNPEVSDGDRLYKVRPIIDHFNSQTKKLYYPGQNLCIDESIIHWRGRLSFRVYLKNKRHKYGIIQYLLTEPNGLILKQLVYAGKNDETSGIGHAKKVVNYLTEDFVNGGHSLFMDSYYNSVGLAEDLLKKNFMCTGTLRKDRRENPQLTQKLKKGEVNEYFSNTGVCVGQWKDKRIVNMISTETTMEMGEMTRKSGTVVTKPKAILLYNKYMSGIDHQDQMQAYYSCERKTIRWYKRLAIHLFSQMLFNSHILYNTYSTKKFTLHDFRHNIINALIGSQRKLPNISILRHKQLHKISRILKRSNSTTYFSQKRKE